MRELNKNEVVQINGAWLGLVFAGARLAWAVYRHHKLASTATWAGRGAGIAGTTYKTMEKLDEWTSQNR